MKNQLIKVDTEKSLAVAKEVLGDISSALDLKVNSEPTLKRAGEYMKVALNASKVIEAERTKIVKPINDSVKEINAMFGAFKENADKVIRYLKGQTDAYAEKLRQEAEQRAKEVGDKMQKGENTATAEKKFENTTEKLDQIPQRTSWEVEVKDFSKVPDEYKILDEQKAKAAARAGIKVEGLEFKQVKKTINRF